MTIKQVLSVVNIYPCHCEGEARRNLIQNQCKTNWLFTNFFKYFHDEITTLIPFARNDNKIFTPAFTLAEVLITLGIIGVVAAMTIPGLMTRYNEAVTVAKVKETYAIFAQAEKRWEEEFDCVGDVEACITGCARHSACELKELVKYMKVSDVIYKNDGSNRSKKSWLSAKSATALDGTTGQTYWGVSKADGLYSVQLLLPNGVSAVLMIDTYAKNIPIFIDVNNSAGPNRIGKDVFPIALGAYKNDYYKGINPYYGEDGAGGDDKGLCSTRNGNICSPDDGHSPTAYILKYGKVFDLRKLGYPK